MISDAESAPHPLESLIGKRVSRVWSCDTILILDFEDSTTLQIEAEEEGLLYFFGEKAE